MYGLILAVILVVVGFILLTMKFWNTGCAMISVISAAIGIVWILLSVGTYIEMETKIPEYNRVQQQKSICRGTIKQKRQIA
ncbi:hypothetical protein [Eubacterium limosum]|mgnify:CR=1 FL=1|uniref:hypothetical protein n=1 Tax=Eubacterium limosum TaxID=1736 RepID=UPI003719A2F5